jgi:hypothetical protein
MYSYLLQLKRTGFAYLLLTFSSAAHADFVPIPLTGDSYNYDVVVERNAPSPVVPSTTASMDAGAENIGFSWYERGYNADAIATGLPVAGALLTSDAAADHQYRFAPSYTARNAILLDAVATNATIILKAPQPYSGLSFLTSSGGGGNTVVRYVVHHLDDSSESGTFISPDWLAGVNPAWSANGRLNVTSFAYDRVNSDYPRLFSSDIALSNVISPVVSINLSYISGIGHTATFALSGASPASTAFVPISFDGYNQDLVVEAGAIHPDWVNQHTTATMDNGTANARTTWYEQGYYPLALTSGLPAPGSLLTNQISPDHCYRLPPSYLENNAALIDAIVSSNSLTPLTASRFSALSFLTASGHGPVTNLCLINHADGTSQTNTVISPDWYDPAPAAFSAGGRVSVSTKIVDSLNQEFPKLFSADLIVMNRLSEITNIVLQFVAGPNDSHTVVFAVSGAVESVPPVFRPKLAIEISGSGSISLASTAPGLLQSASTLSGTNTIWRNEGPISQVMTIPRSQLEPIRFYRVLAY